MTPEVQQTDQASSSAEEMNVIDDVSQPQVTPPDNSDDRSSEAKSVADDLPEDGSKEPEDDGKLKLPKLEQPDSSEDDSKDDDNPTDDDISQQTQQQLPKKRDYSKFKPEDVQYLRKLPNKEFAAVSERLAALYETEQKLAEAQEKLKTSGTFYDHPEAYTLQGEYRQAVDNYGKADFEGNHYYQQFIAINKGAKAYSVIESYQNGQPQYKQYKVTDENRAAVGASLQATWQQAEGIKNDVLKNINGIKQSYINNYNQSKSFIDNVANDFFNKLPENLKPAEKDVTAFAKQMPAVYRDHPMTALAAKMYGFIMRQGAMLNEYATKANKQGKLNLDAKRASPNISGKKSTDDKLNDESLVIEDAEKFMHNMV